MRKKTLGSVFALFLVAILLLLKFFASPDGLWLPLIGFVSPVVAFFTIFPLALILVTAINQQLVSWQKAHGRDVELEERHEFDDADIISLRERQPHEHSSTYRGLHDDD